MLRKTYSIHFLFFFSSKDGQVVAVAFAPDGTKIVSGSHDRNVKVWDVSTGNCVWTFAGHRYTNFQYCCCGWSLVPPILSLSSEVMK
jgi:WD40 repeat protein